MGYTHYFSRKAILPMGDMGYPPHPEYGDLWEPWGWAAFQEVNRRLYAKLPKHSTSAGAYYTAYPLTICGPDGMGAPIFSDKCVNLNGQADAAPSYAGAVPVLADHDMSHENLYIPRVARQRAPFVFKDAAGRHESFCKTARKPYDLLVCAILLNFKHTFGDAVSIDSDGDAAEWRPAVEFYEAVTERRAPAYGPWNDQPAQRTA